MGVCRRLTRHMVPTPRIGPRAARGFACCTQVLRLQLGMSEALRRRVPFVSSEEDDGDTRVLDEQGAGHDVRDVAAHLAVALTCMRSCSDDVEQEEVIQNLKDKSARAEWQYNLLLEVLITLSFVLYAFDPTRFVSAC